MTTNTKTKAPAFMATEFNVNIKQSKENWWPHIDITAKYICTDRRDITVLDVNSLRKALKKALEEATSITQKEA